MNVIRASIVTGAALSLMLAACGGEGGADARQTPPLDASPPTSGDAAAGDPAQPPDTAAGAGAAAPADGGDAEADTGQIGRARDWSDRPVRTRPDQGAPATLRAVRTARHETYDRIVFEFADRIPGYSVAYADQPPAQCGSGRQVDVGAPFALSVDLRPAAAHDESGNATVQDRSRTPGLPVLKTARLTCDFEAVVEWVIGAGRRAPVRVLELTSPARLVVDFAHR